MTEICQILHLQHSVLEKSKKHCPSFFMLKVYLSKIVISLHMNVLESDMNEPNHLQVAAAICFTVKLVVSTRPYELFINAEIHLVFLV
jgi:hypothetical protein